MCAWVLRNGMEGATCSLSDVLVTWSKERGGGVKRETVLKRLMMPVTQFWPIDGAL